ncbi:hypothetical protein F4861DRAFT_436636 [Xylaria intraflava]|nr:hypothetical protein F4861DRAFT_436636 [Xylaria intraflava]
MSPQLRPPDQSPRRRPLRSISDRRANANHETPLIKTLLRNKIKTPLPRPPPSAQHHKPRERPKPWDLITRKLSGPEQFNDAVRVFTCLSSIPGLSGVRPRLYGQDRDQLEIQLYYPKYKFWRVVDRLHSYGDSREPRMQVYEVRQLRETLLKDISILCASHIAFQSDASVLRVTEHRRKSIFSPLLNTFDFHTAKEANNIDWTELEKTIVRKIEMQFQVFELFAQFNSDTQPQQQSSTKLDPEETLRILRVNPPSYREMLRVILQVGRYTPELARYIIENTKELPLGDPALTSYCDAIRHVIRLSTIDECAQQSISLLADRASLWVVYTAMLVHLHAKVKQRSQGLLRLTRPGPAEAYTSCEGFNLVVEAHREARGAIRTLYDAGGELDRTTRCYIRG